MAWPGGLGWQRALASRRLISRMVSGMRPGSAGGGASGLAGGKYLADELPVIYGEQAAAVVMFISAESGIPTSGFASRASVADASIET